MKRAFRISIVVLLPLITLSLGWGLGTRYAQQQVADMMSQLEFLYQGKTASGILVHDPEKEVNLALLWGVWRLLQQHYIAPEKLETTNMLFGATSGLVRALDDPYTTFMTPRENTDFKEGLGGKLHGIGAELTMKDGSVVVVAPLKGSPAQEAGLLPEDTIIMVDGTDITNETLTNVVRRIRGPKGTNVKLTILRKEQMEPMELTIRRDDIQIPSVEAEVKKTASGAIGIIALNQFGDETVREVEAALRSFQKEKEPIRGIVIDLRFNGGGYLDGAVELASLFLRQGKVVTVQRREGEPVSHYVNGRPLDSDLPLAVIINEGSASASEIFAGAIQDHERGIIVGKTSFGKGTVQEVFDLPGGSSLRVTVARWLTPGGKDLSKEGIHPDIDVNRSPEDLAAKSDPQLDAAIEWLLDHEEHGIPVARPAELPLLKQKVGKEIDTAE
ncbi:MAG: S41 family peptidase [Candidatus Peregrinibacteria bacterium]